MPQTVPTIYVSRVVAMPIDACEERKSVEIAATVVNTTDEEIEVDLIASVGRAASLSGDLELPARGEARITFGISDLRAQLWEPDDPALFEAAVELENGHRLSARFGFRTAEFRGEEFFLNGRRIDLQAVARVEGADFGRSAPPRIQARDALTIQRELGCNLVVAVGGPPGSDFLDACDEVGLLLAIQPAADGDPRSIEALLAERGRPAIVAWDLRASDARGAELRRLDPSRSVADVSAIARRCPPALLRDRPELAPGGVWRAFSSVEARAPRGDGPVDRIELEADDDELDADGIDATRVVIRARDALGVVTRSAGPVTLRVEGPGALVGDNPALLAQGVGVVYVRAGREPGRIIVRVAGAGVGEATIGIDAVAVAGP